MRYSCLLQHVFHSAIFLNLAPRANVFSITCLVLN